MSLFLTLAVVFSSAFIRPALAFDGAAFKKDAPIEVSGESVIYDNAKKIYLAEGDVVIIQGDMTLTALKAVLDMTEGKARAEGNVVVTKSDGNYMTADSLDVDMDKETAVIVNGNLYFIDNNIYVYGSEIKKTGKETFESSRIKITSCDCENDESPAWSFSARDAKVTKEGYFTGFHSFFYIKDVPVLYSPYVVLPVKTKRQTGFLTPV
ncbi:MAG: LptA/OstA family protein, partial [Thermodesulfobacteriota bacterium]